MTMAALPGLSRGRPRPGGTAGSTAATAPARRGWPFSCAFWVVMALAVRLAAIAAAPVAGQYLLDRERAPLGAAAAGHPTALEFLERRSEWRPLDQDEPAYDDAARHVAAGRGIVMDRLFMINTPGRPTAFTGLVYPLFVGGIYRVVGEGNQLPVMVVQAVLQALAAGFICATAARLAGPWAGLFAAAWFTFHPPLVWSSLALVTESVMVPLVAALLWLLSARHTALAGRPWARAALTGLLAVLLAQTRSTFAVFAPVAAGLVWRENRSRHGRVRRLGPAALALAVFAAVTLPWAARNRARLGRWIPFSTKSAMAYMFNHDGLRVEFGRRAVDGPIPVDVYSPGLQDLPGEAARAERLQAMAVRFVEEKPATFAGLCWMRFWLALLPVRLTSTSRTALVAVWYDKGLTLLALLALAALLLGRRLRGGPLLRRAAPVALLLATWQAVQSLAGPGVRYRLPSDPAWAVAIGVIGAVLLASLRPGVFGVPLARRWLRAPGPPGPAAQAAS
jgi:4-amino-4-deoxy-L-arabinose transferase-like glycosyltransferase